MKRGVGGVLPDEEGGLAALLVVLVMLVLMKEVSDMVETTDDMIEG